MLDIVLDELQEVDFEGFEPAEVAGITRDYVCAHCYSVLVAFNIPNDRLYIIVCSHCAVNIEEMGVVTKTTVNIRMEQGRREYKQVVQNLRDLYPTIDISIKHTPLRAGESPEDRNIRELGFY